MCQFRGRLCLLCLALQIFLIPFLHRTDVICLHAVSTDTRLRGVFQAGIPKVMVRIRSRDLGIKVVSKTRVSGRLDGEMRIILRSIVLRHCRRVETDGHAAYIQYS